MQVEEPFNGRTFDEVENVIGKTENQYIDVILSDCNPDIAELVWQKWETNVVLSTNSN